MKVNAEGLPSLGPPKMMVGQFYPCNTRSIRERWPAGADGSLNAIWYIEGIYSSLRVQHNNGTGIRREGKRGEKQT